MVWCVLWVGEMGGVVVVIVVVVVVVVVAVVLVILVVVRSWQVLPGVGMSC